MSPRAGKAVMSGIILAAITFIVVKEFTNGLDTSSWSTLEITLMQTLFPLLALVAGFLGVFSFMGSAWWSVSLTAYLSKLFRFEYVTSRLAVRSFMGRRLASTKHRATAFLAALTP